MTVAATGALTALGLAATPAAVAQPGPGELRERLGPESGYGVELAVGGGVTDFASAETRAQSEPGGTWEVRATFGTRIPIGFQLAYVGTVQNITTEGVDLQAYLVSNGAEAAFRLAFPLGGPAFVISPFATAGVGWSRFSLKRAAFGPSGIRKSDDVWMVPFSAGLFASIRGFTLDGRFSYRQAFQDGLLAGADLTHWRATIDLGREF